MNPTRNVKLKLETFVPYRLSIASNRVSDLIAESYRDEFQISVTEWRVISILAERQELTQGQLCEISRMDKVTVSRAAQRLTKERLVRRQAHPGDGRSHHLGLTDKGRSIYDLVVPKVLAIEKEILSGFSKSEVANLTQLLRRLEDPI